ncbi:MAG: hypothetical protein ACLP4V_01865 [Methylocella sp.]
MIAKPKAKPPPPSAKKRRGRHGGSDGRESRLWRPTPIKARKLGLAAVKHKQQQQAERAQQHREQQGRAFVALAHVVAAASSGGWPESMQRELQSCATPEARQAWSIKWGAYLSGQVERERRGAAPERPQGGGMTNGGNPHPS